MEATQNAEKLNKKALKSGIYYTICNFIVRGAGFITTPIFTRLLSGEDVGTFSNFTAWISILSVLATLDLYSSLAVAKYDYKNSIDNYISSILVLGTIVTAIFYTIVLLFSGFFMKVLSLDFKSLNLMFIYFLVQPALHMFQTRNQIYFNYKTSTIVSLLSVGISVCSSLLFTIISTNKLEGRLFGYYIPSIIFDLIIYVYLLIKGGKISTKYWKYSLTISLPLVAHTLSAHVLSSSDRVMITNLCGTSFNALYSVAYTCALVISILCISVNSAWAPWSMEMFDRNDSNTLKRVSKIYSVIFFVFLIAYLLLAPEILLIMGGKKYSEAIAVIPPVIIGYFFQFVYTIFVNAEFYYKKQKIIAVATTIAAAANVGLNYLFIPIFGYAAAAFTTLVGYIIMFVLHVIVINRIKKDYFFDIRFLIMISVCSLICIPAAYFLYQAPIVRMGLIFVLFAAIAIFIIRFRNEIKLFIKTKSFDVLGEIGNKIWKVS